MAELTDIERELLNPAEEHSAVLFKEILNTRMLFSYLRVIVPIAHQRGLVHWFTEMERAPIQ